MKVTYKLLDSMEEYLETRLDEQGVCEVFHRDILMIMQDFVTKQLEEQLEEWKAKK